MTDNSLSKIPYWDGKAESSGVCVSKIKAYAKFVGVGDALDPILMANCPNKLEFTVIDVTNPTNVPLVGCTRQTRSCAVPSHWSRERGMVLFYWARQRVKITPTGLHTGSLRRPRRPISPLMLAR